MDTRLLSIEEAADRLGLRRSKTYQLIQAGELGSIKIGKSRRIPESLLAEFVERLIAEQVQEGSR